MSAPVWIGLDLGTQSVRALAADDAGTVLATHSQPLRSSRRDGRAHTQEPAEWWAAVCTCCQAVMAQLTGSPDVRGVAVDATSGTILLTDQQGEAATEAWMYDDGRATAEAAEVQAAGEPLWTSLGYRMQPAWALPKLLHYWRTLASPAPGLRLTHQNDFINARLAGMALPTDTSHALKTGYDLLRTRWPADAFATLGLPLSLFPEVVSPGTTLGVVGPSEAGLPAGTPIIAGMTDGCAAQIAAGAVHEGDWHSVLGTTLVVKGVSAHPVGDPDGALYSHRAPDGWWLPGGASSTGAGIVAKLFPQADLAALEAQAAAQGPTDLVVYPLHAAGERFPFVAPAAEYFQLGEPRHQAELYRAVLQGVAFLERLSYDYLAHRGAPALRHWSTSGGGARSALWNQLRAGILEQPLAIPATTEPAFGMAILAASTRSSLSEAAARMVKAPGVTIAPTTGAFALHYAKPYRALLQELTRRGWLPAGLATYSLARLP